MRTVVTLSACLLLSVTLFAQEGISFFEGSWDEAKEAAAAQDKLIFVDCYTTWCGPCKWMDANVFPKEEVGQFMNEHFISVKLDMEKEGDGMEMREYMEVNSFPTYLFFDGSAEPIHRSGSSMPVEKFMDLVHAAMDPNQQYYTMAKDMEQQKQDPEWLLNFAVATSNAGVPIADVLEQYESITNEQEWSLPHNWERIVKLQVPFESGIYAYVAKNEKQLSMEMPDQEAFEFFLDYPRSMYVRRAVYYTKEEAGLQPHFEKINEVLSDHDAPAMIAKLHAEWYKKHEPEHAWEKVVLYMDQFCDAPHEFNGAAWDLVENETTDKAKLEKGLEWVNRSIEAEPSYNNLDTKAWLLFLMGDASEAELAANEAIKLAKEAGQDYEGTTELIQKIHGS